MRIDVLTLFPEMLSSVLSSSILGRAIGAGLIEVNPIQLRSDTTHRQRCTDDYPYGGGAGMVMFAQPIVDAVTDIDPEHRARRIYLSPRGRTLNQRIVESLAQEERLLMLCGHYEGVDERALELCIDEELSIGDYVLTGGELGALTVIDAVARLVPGVLGSEASGEDESFTTGLLEYPQYTRPADFRGRRVPEVLLGGNHADIEYWRREQSLRITLERRPELLDSAPLDETQARMLERIRAEKALIHLLEGMGAICASTSLAEADAFPKAWIDAFVPPENRKAAKKLCVSGKRHVGFPYQAFTHGLTHGLEGEAANEALTRAMPENVKLYFPKEAVLISAKLPQGFTSNALKTQLVLVDEPACLAYLTSGKAQLGPWYIQLDPPPQ